MIIETAAAHRRYVACYVDAARAFNRRMVRFMLAAERAQDGAAFDDNVALMTAARAQRDSAMEGARYYASLGR